MKSDTFKATSDHSIAFLAVKKKRPDAKHLSVFAKRAINNAINALRTEASYVLYVDQPSYVQLHDLSRVT